MSGISAGLDQGFFQGGGLSQLVPNLYPVAIDGRPYLVDLKSGQFKRQSIQLLRQQADTSNLPGEASINPEDLWRRSQETWHHGAGQIHYDRPDSNPARFRASKGIDVWTKWQLSLLNDTQRKTPATTNVNQHLVVAGSFLYWADGATLRRTADPTVGSPTWTTITGLNTNPIVGLASDGYNVWIAQGGQGLYVTNNSTTVATQMVTGNVGGVAFMKGERLMIVGSGVDKHRIWNVTTANNTNTTLTTGTTALFPDPLKSHRNTDFTWVGFAEGQGVIYAAGYSGDKSYIYRTTVRPEGTGLDIPVVAAEFPDGEIVRSMQGYLGFVVAGTDQGVRFATSDQVGNLTLGSLIRTNVSVLCFEPQDRFVWFGWTNYDSQSTGLGRLDLQSFVAPLTPAYASDLMVQAAGTVTAIVTFGSRRYFTVSGYGLVGEINVPVPSGVLESGRIHYGMPDTKVAMYVNARHQPLAGNVVLSIAVDGESYVTLGQNSVELSTLTSLPVGQRSGGYFELRLGLLPGGGGVSPFVTRLTLRAYPGPARGEIFIVPLMLYEIIQVGGQEEFLDPLSELNAIRSMVTDHRLVAYQEAGVQRAVFVEDYEWTPHSETMDGTFWNGTCVVKLKSVSEV